MFKEATSFNSDLSKWKVGNVTNLAEMFLEATSFNSDLSGWKVGNVIRMYRMFDGATSFASDLSRWNVRGVEKVENMEGMFRDTASFGPPLKQGDDRGWTPESLAEHTEFVAAKRDRG